MKKIKWILPVLLAVIGMTSCSIVDVGNKGSAKKVGTESTYGDNFNPGPSYIKIWGDEFDGTSLDTTKWTCEINGNGSGNGELEYYTDRPNNVSVSGGKLVIQALRENYGGKSFTSARLDTYGKFFMRFGKIAASIKVPQGFGIWPAFWMMGKNYKDVGWPNCGEIDLLEMAGGQGGAIGDQISFSTLHWYEVSAGYTGYADYGTRYTNSTALANDYHVWEMEWTPTDISMFVDGLKVYDCTIAAGLDAFTYPQYILLNLAVGGAGVFNPAITDPNAITAAFPAQMLVDWVRVYSNTSIVLPASPAATQPLQIYSETHTGLNAMSRGGVLNVWGGTGTLAAAGNASEGNECWQFTVGNVGWMGFGISAAFMKDNLTSYQNTYLMFNIKTTSKAGYEVGLGGAGISRWVALTAANGYVADGNWHQIRIPMSAFAGIDFSMITMYFQFVSTSATTAGDVLYFDDIYWTSSSDVYNPPAGPVNQNILLNCETKTGWNPFLNGAALDIWSGTCTINSVASAASEGATGWQIVVGTGGWLGLGISSKPAVDLSSYINSTLNFDIKTTTPNSYLVGIGSADGVVVYQRLQSTPGYAADGNWHTISIPLNQFGGVNFSQIGQYFMMLNEANVTAGEIINIDNLYIAAGNAPKSSSAPAASSVSSTPTTSTPAVSSSSSVVVVSSSVASSVSSASGVTKATIVAAAASTINGANTAALSFDGNTGTRWESASADPQWIYWDLGSAKPLNSIIIDWEAAAASNYTVQGSADASTWTVLATAINTTYMVNHTIITNSLSGTYRYVRMYGTTRATPYGYSIWEVSIYTGAAASSSSTPVISSSVPVVSSSKISSSAVSSSAVSSSAVSSSGITKAVISTAVASTVNGANTAALSFDGNTGTRWESASTDPQWIYWDLGSAKPLSSIMIDWEVASASNYTIQGSTDAATWTILATVMNASKLNHTQVTTALSGTYRYVKMNGTTRTSPYAYSIWEVSIYTGTAPASSSSPAISSSSSSTAVSSTPSVISIVSATASTYVNGNTAALSCDGNNTGTRWESASADPQWIYWDLGSNKQLSSVIIDWEAAAAANYTIQGSTDAATWTILGTAVNSAYMVNHTIITNSVSGTYRYVKMNGTTRLTPFGYSIWEVTIK